jgi:predicted DNA-binding protein (UPF0251 family)
MSPRIKTLRKISNLPVIKGFKPYGRILGTIPEAIILHYEEYEALRLCDYDNYNHQQASLAMGVSRPTFTRIYASALKKIAQSFVEGRGITIAGGKVYFDSDWYECNTCSCFFNNPEKENEITNCPLCNSISIAHFDFSDSQENSNKDKFCFCPNCGYEKKRRNRKRITREICPVCKIDLNEKPIF